MDQDILLYGSIWEYNAVYFFDQIKEAQENFPEANLVIRINTSGGSPEIMHGLVNKVKELAEADKARRVVIDGRADSSGLFMLCYVKSAEAVDTAQGVLHRAAYSDYWESRPEFEGSIEAQSLALTNKQLEKAFRAKVNVEVLEALPQFKDKNLTLKDIFSMDGREEVLLSAKDMKAVGLIDKIITITPKKAAEITERTQALNGCRNIEQIRAAAQSFSASKRDEPKSENTIMNLAELKEKHPAIYAEAIAEGKKLGAAEEKDRVEAALVYVDVDPAEVKKIIETGANLSQKQMAEFSRKLASQAALGKIADASAKDINTPPAGAELSDKEKKVAAFEAGVDKALAKK